MERTHYDYGEQMKCMQNLGCISQVKRVLSLCTCGVSSGLGSVEDLHGLIGSITKWSFS
jgi:hypothetical protein